MPLIEEELTVKDFLEAYQRGRRSFKNVCLDAEAETITGMQLDDLAISDSIFEVQFVNCSVRHSCFERCGIKLLHFEKCDLTGTRISECAIECFDIVDCNWTGMSFGKNYAYGCTFEGSELIERLSTKNSLFR